jgi:hypothetical protein
VPSVPESSLPTDPAQLLLLETGVVGAIFVAVYPPILRSSCYWKPVLFVQ